MQPRSERRAAVPHAPRRAITPADSRVSTCETVRGRLCVRERKCESERERESGRERETEILCVREKESE